MEGVEAVVAAAEEERSPAILQVRSTCFKVQYGIWHDQILTFSYA